MGERREGVVIAHFGVEVALLLDDGARVRVTVGRDSHHVVGDRAVLERASAGRGDELTSLRASGVLRRRDSHGRVRAIASNLDALGIVLAPRPISPQGFVDRAIVAARAAGIEPFLLVNKSDLPGASELANELRESHPGLARRFLASAQTGQGLETLAAWLACGRRAVFVGTSGVGKSALSNALCPDAEQQVGEINELSGLGRHVTSAVSLHRLPAGGELVDTPGFRDFGPTDVSSRELAAHFPGFETALAEPCRFRDCRHQSEPGCVVHAAIAAGAITPARHRAYLELLADLEQSEAALRGY